MAARRGGLTGGVSGGGGGGGGGGDGSTEKTREYGRQWMARDPSKRWAELFYLAYAPVWIAMIAAVVGFQWYTWFEGGVFLPPSRPKLSCSRDCSRECDCCHCVGVHYFVTGIIIAAPIFVVPLIINREPIPWRERFCLLDEFPTTRRTWRGFLEHALACGMAVFILDDLFRLLVGPVTGVDAANNSRSAAHPCAAEMLKEVWSERIGTKPHVVPMGQPAIRARIVDRQKGPHSPSNMSKQHGLFWLASMQRVVVSRSPESMNTLLTCKNKLFLKNSNKLASQLYMSSSSMSSWPMSSGPVVAPDMPPLNPDPEVTQSSRVNEDWLEPEKSKTSISMERQHTTCWQDLPGRVPRQTPLHRSRLVAWLQS
ncbi:uncharacterized protein MONBRDRAFT_8620 [Monosiga brevicollis MX1]|uniref:Uncharacterized protein n=1 Tax=Monosiga brevicollis TaxID=81824 RepID=A9V0L2_MONBE|nr:uncharacterized protein MONBRDRAFT_8620 [Monosiga brevicollis MX1]EDQ89035.1 predicted protein [Monosiga brevicollis MX1]|eukprot:XP_001746140.1 hypothetical protein [Monosiga brevicollis MX1]